MGVDIAIVEDLAVGQINQKAAEQSCVRSRGDAQKQIGLLGRCGAARVDHNNFRAALLPVPDHALEQYGMAPGGIGPDQDKKLGRIEILIGAGNRVGAERATVTGDRRRHAKSRIRIDIARADEAFHQLVGDVIVLGEKLAGEIEGNGIGAVPCDDPPQSIGDTIKSICPINAREAPVGLSQHGVQQSSRKPQRLIQSRTLGAEAAEICGMVGIAGNAGSALSIGARQHATADAAIRTDRAHRRSSTGRPVHGRRRMACLPMGRGAGSHGIGALRQQCERRAPDRT
jgi:hypothetical protein